VEDGSRKYWKENGKNSGEGMTNKQFVLSVYPEALCQISTPRYLLRPVFAIMDDSGCIGCIGYSRYSSTVAWRAAAQYLRKRMLDQLEKE
jgi:hypothetical protein